MPEVNPKRLDVSDFNPDPKKLFENIKEFKKDPLAPSYFKELFKEHENSPSAILYGHYALKHYKDFQEMPWAKEIIAKAIKITPQDAFKYVNFFIDQKWAEKLCINAAKESPMAAFLYLKKYKHMDWAENVVMAATKKEPSTALLNAKLFKKETWAENIIEEAGKSNPKALLKFMKYFKEMKWAEETVHEAAKKKPFNYFIELPSVKETSWAGKIAIELADDAGPAVFAQVKHFKEMKWAEKVIEIAAKKDYSNVFIFIENFKDKPWAKKIYFAALEKNPNSHFTYLKYILDQPWAFDVIKQGIQKQPGSVYLDLKNLKGYSKLEDVLIYAAQTNPEETFFNHRDIKGLEWYSSLLTIAGNHMPESSNIFFDPEFEKLVKKHITNDIVKEDLLKKIKKADKFAEEYLQTQIKGDEKRLLWNRIGKDEIKGRLSLDRSIKHTLAIKEVWLKPKPISSYETKQFQIMIARNLYFQKLPPIKKNVEVEYSRILALRKKYKDVPIFKGRDVVLVANNEKYRGKYRYGRTETQKSIKAQGGKLHFIRPQQKSVEALKKAKKDVLDRIATMPTKSTFYFAGHGGPNAFYLSDGDIVKNKPKETKSTVKITAYEFAQALIKRQGKFPNESPPTIFVFESCYSGAFLRKVYSRLNPKKSMPIMLGASEYYQYTYGQDKFAHSGYFNEKVLQLGKKGQTTTLGTVMDNELKGMSNPTLYIPSKKGGIRHIAAKRKKKQTLA